MENKRLPEWLQVTLAVGGFILFFASLINLFFAPACWGLLGFFAGASAFLLGWGELLEA
jgi:hypothetical protein